MVTPESLTKVLDFGLPSWIAAPPLSLDDDEKTRSIYFDATPNRGRTIVGTVAYMSPEQAEAARWTLVPISFPSARFSTNFHRQRTFKGKTSLQTLTAVLRMAPHLPCSRPERRAARVEEIIMRCLARSRQRWHP